MLVDIHIQPRWGWYALVINHRFAPMAIHVKPLRGYKEQFRGEKILVI